MSFADTRATGFRTLQLILYLKMKNIAVAVSMNIWAKFFAASISEHELVFSKSGDSPHVMQPRVSS
jgi:hypothetical protein